MISLVLPTRNETMLEETIRSGFSAGADEIVVVDDVSRRKVVRGHVLTGPCCPTGVWTLVGLDSYWQCEGQTATVHLLSTLQHSMSGILRLFAGQVDMFVSRKTDIGDFGKPAVDTLKTLEKHKKAVDKIAWGDFQFHLGS